MARAYDRLLDASVTRPPRQADLLSAWAQYCVLLKDRDAVAKALAAEGIPTAIYYPRPMHMQSAYARFGRGPGSLPVSERLSAHILALPMHPYLDDATTERIAGAVNAALAKSR